MRSSGIAGRPWIRPERGRWRIWHRDRIRSVAVSMVASRRLTSPSSACDRGRCGKAKSDLTRHPCRSMRMRWAKTRAALSKVGSFRRERLEAACWCVDAGKHRPHGWGIESGKGGIGADAIARRVNTPSIQVGTLAHGPLSMPISGAGIHLLPQVRDPKSDRHWAAELRVQQTVNRERLVADHLGIHAESRPTGQQQPGSPFQSRAHRLAASWR